MTDTTNRVREHYSAADLTDRIKSALATIVPEDEKLTVAQLAPLDQFHAQDILATAELADAAELAPSTPVLDLGCGIGGPARYLAATFYVLEGSIVTQVKGGKEVTLTPCQSFYQGPDDIHVVGRNASKTEAAKFVVFLVKDKGAPVLIPAN